MKTRNTFLSSMICVVIVCFCMVSIGSANGIEFLVMQQGGMYSAEILSVVNGGTSVQMQKVGDPNVMNFDQFGSEFEIMTEEHATLADLNNQISGSYTMTVAHSGGTSQYSFDIANVLDEWFPAAPVLSNTGPQVPQQYTFHWSWSGTADLKYIDWEAWNATDEVQFEQPIFSGDAGFADLSANADFGTIIGEGDFIIAYVNINDNMISNWSLESGTDIFAGEVMKYIASEDSINFQVVPEPVTMSIMALGGLAMLRRHKA